MIVKNRLRHIEEAEYFAVLHRVINVIAILPAHHKTSAAEYAELLGEITLLNIQARAKLVHANLAITQSIQDSNAEGMSKSFKKFSLELTQFRHSMASVYESEFSLLTFPSSDESHPSFEQFHYPCDEQRRSGRTAGNVAVHRDN